jgi:hypothetical protein
MADVTGAADLVAESILTADGLATSLAADALVADSTLITDAATIFTADVALVADSTLITPAVVVGPTPVDLGAITVFAELASALTLAQSGTLANPYAASDSDTRVLDFASALFVATEPVALTGPAAAPSIWYEFTESQVADWLASTSGFAHGADIELYAGPPGAGPDDLTFIATDGSSLVTLGAVTVSALATTVATPLRAELVDLGAVVVAASPVNAMALT